MRTAVSYSPVVVPSCPGIVQNGSKREPPANAEITDITNREHIEARVLNEQVTLMCRLTTSPLFGSVILGIMMAYLGAEDHGVTATVGWYVVLLLVLLLRWRVAAAFLRRPRDLADTKRWRAAMMAGAALGGLVWSVAGSFLLPHDPTREVIMSVLFIGATASGMGSQAPVRHAYACLLIPFIVPHLITQFLLGGDRVILGLAFMLYMPIMLVIAGRQTKSIERQIRLAIENESLIEQLRQERDRAVKQAQELRLANNDLEGFSYSVSHDLRAPLRAIDGFSRLLGDDKSRSISPETRHYLQRIRANVSHMSSLIDDLLEFARCGRQSLEQGRLDMEMLARLAAEEAHASRLNEAKEPVISIGKLPTARGDERLIRQVWVNLLDNAVKYSSKAEQPHINVSGREDGERRVYEISDNGVGFDSKFTSNLFGVFRRLHGAREYPGTGVGLAIVHRIVTRHGGEVWAHSEPGRGATFSFSLPT